jgi:hypothetical protein
MLGQIGLISQLQKAFKFDRFGSIYNLEVQGKVKMHLVALGSSACLIATPTSYSIKQLESALQFVANRLSTIIQYSSFFGKPFRGCHTGLWHLL